MAFDPILAERVRVELARHVDYTERNMFGGLAFLVGGNMCCGITGTDLMLRLSPESAELALQAEHTRPMDFTGKPMKSMIFVNAEGSRTDAALRKWIRAAVDVAKVLPPKAPKAPRRAKTPKSARA